MDDDRGHEASAILRQSCNASCQIVRLTCGLTTVTFHGLHEGYVVAPRLAVLVELAVDHAIAASRIASCW